MAAQTASAPTVSKGAVISLREITKQNWREITDLCILPSQQGNVTNNLKSLCEAHYSEDAWVRGIYADDTPVGFLMMSIWDPEEWYSIWRFMIDHRHQKMGFGSRAIKLAIEHVKRDHPQAKLMRLMSASAEGKGSGNGKNDVDARDSPYWFYRALGFKDLTAVDENGEVEMGLEL
jgi:diamine N-acetyltransferase